MTHLRIEAVADLTRFLADRGHAEAMDSLGHRSAVAQGLVQPITSTTLLSRPAAVEQQQELIVAWASQEESPSRLVGFLKTGVKHLYYLTREGKYKEMDPLCVLDFYVKDTCQRQGIGLLLFQALLGHAQISASRLAYDRPSPKLHAFLAKHAALTAFFPQPNNFVIFDAYFDDDH